MTILVGCSGWSYDDWVGAALSHRTGQKEGRMVGLLRPVLRYGRDQQHLLPSTRGATSPFMD